MLQAMRGGTKSIFIKIVLFGFLLMALLGLAVMDVQGVFQNGMGTGPLAKIGRSRISAVEFDRTLDMYLRQQNIPRNLAVTAGIPQQVLEEEVNSRLFVKSANDLGFIVDDAKAAQAVKVLLQPLVKQGLTEKDALNRMMTGLGISEDSLVNSVKSEIATEVTLRLLTSGTQPPQELQDAALEYKYEARRGNWFKLTTADIDAKTAAPADKELEEYYQTIAPRFALPEYRTLAVLKLDAKTLGIDGNVSDEDARAYYDAHKSEYGTLETRTIAQAVARDEKTAREIIAKAAATKDLAAAAEGVTFIPARTVSEKDLPAELAPAAFAVAEGEIAGPVKSPLGWHILHVTQVLPEKIRDFDSVKAEIKSALALETVAEDLYKRANEIDDMIGGGQSLAEVGQEFSITPVIIEKTDATGKNAKGENADTAGLPLPEQIITQGFQLAAGEAGQLIETPDGAFLIVETREVYPPENRPFKDVRAAVLAAWKDKEASAAFDKAVADLTGRIKLGEAFDALAKDFGKTAVATPFVTRTTPAESESLDRRIIPSLFSLGHKGETTAFASTDGVIVLRLADRRVNTPDKKDKEEAAALENMLQRTLAGGILSQYRAHLMEAYDVTVNTQMLQAMYKPEEEKY